MQPRNPAALETCRICREARQGPAGCPMGLDDPRDCATTGVHFGGGFAHQSALVCSTDVCGPQIGRSPDARKTPCTQKGADSGRSSWGLYTQGFSTEDPVRPRAGALSAPSCNDTTGTPRRAYRTEVALPIRACITVIDTRHTPHQHGSTLQTARPRGTRQAYKTEGFSAAPKPAEKPRHAIAWVEPGPTPAPRTGQWPPRAAR